MTSTNRKFVNNGIMHIKRKLGTQGNSNSKKFSVWASNDLNDPKNENVLTMAICISIKS